MLMFRKPSCFIAVHMDKCSECSFPAILGDTSCPSIGRVGWLVGLLVGPCSNFVIISLKVYGKMHFHLITCSSHNPTPLLIPSPRSHFVFKDILH